MKKVIVIVLLLCFISCPAYAQKVTLSQGLYKVNELKIVISSSHNVQLVSSSSNVTFMVFNSDHIMQQYIILNNNFFKYNRKPFSYDSVIVVVGDGDVILE
jgi:hypothetical protein